MPAARPAMRPTFVWWDEGCGRAAAAAWLGAAVGVCDEEDDVDEDSEDDVVGVEEDVELVLSSSLRMELPKVIACEIRMLKASLVSCRGARYACARDGAGVICGLMAHRLSLDVC